MSSSRRWRRWLKIALVSVAALAAVAGLLVAGLYSRAARPYIARQASVMLSELLVGALRVGRIREFAGGWIVLEDVEARDERGNLVVRVARLEAQIDLNALRAHKIILTKADARGAWVSLHEGADGLAIAKIFLLSAPSAPEPETPGGTPWSFAIRKVTLRGAEVVNMPGGLSARGVHAQGTLSYTDGFHLTLTSARAGLADARGAQAALRVRRSGLHLVDGAGSSLDADVQVGRDLLTVRAALRWGETLRTDLRLTGQISESGLRAARLEPVAAMLRAPVGVEIAASLGERSALRARLATAGGELALEGVHVGSRTQLSLRTSALALARVVALDDLPSAACDLTLYAEANSAADYRASLHVRSLQYGDLVLPEWTVRWTLDARGAHLLALEVPSFAREQGKLEADIALGLGGDVRGSLHARLPGIRSGRALARATGARSDALHASLTGSYGARDDALKLRGALEVASLRVGGAAVAGLQAAIDARGKLARPQLSAQLDAHGISAGKLRVTSASLTASGGPERYALRSKLAFGELSADADLTLALRGTETSLSGTVQVARHGTRSGSLTLAGALDPERGKLRAEVSASSRNYGDLKLALSGALAARGSLGQRLQAAHYELSAEGDQDLEKLSALWRMLGVDQTPHGRLSFTTRLAGKLPAPGGELSLRGSELSWGAIGPFDTQLDARWSDSEGALALALADQHGALAAFSADVRGGPLAIVAAARAQGLRTLPASYQLSVRERALSELPQPLKRDLPLRASLEAELVTSDHLPPRARVAVEGQVTGVLDHACPKGEPPRLHLAATLEGGQLGATLCADRGGPCLFNAELKGLAPTFALNEGRLVGGDLTLSVDGNDLDLAGLPGTCGKLTGTLAFSARAQGLMSPQPQLSARVKAANLRVGTAQPVEFALVARADRDQLHVTSADIRQASRYVLRGEARLPWRWDGESKLEPDLARCDVRVQLSELPLATVLSALPGFAQAAGHADGAVAVTRCSAPLAINGKLTLTDAAFAFQDSPVRVDNLGAKLSFDDKGLVIESFKLLDQDGVMSGKGRLRLADGKPAGVELTAKAQSFPIRSDAAFVGSVDGKLSLSATLNQVPRRVRVALRELNIRLPARGSRHAHEIEPHPDVVFVNTRAPAAKKSASDEAPPTPLLFELDASQPFWLRRDDFGLQLSATLRARSDEQGLRVWGPVDVQHGFINVLGKGFDMERGQLVFDGSEKIDPTVTIDAVHKLSDGHKVTIRIRDRVSAPEVTFSSNVPGATTPAEVMQLLVRGRESTTVEAAQAQVGAALAGLTSGLIGSMTRGSLGKYVPVLSLEAGASSGTRMRAGVEANALIPKPLRKVIEGAYIEGFVGSKNQGGNAQATGGMLMELYFPKRVVTGGTWELPNNWSVEATWEP